MWAGNENKWEETRFRFFCKDEQCFEKTKNSFFFYTYEKPPKKIPKSVQCPLCGSKAEYAPEGPGISFKGGGWTGKFYDRDSNESKAKEHYQQHIRDTKEAIKGESGVSPYAKMEINHEYWKEKGVARKVTDKEAVSREKIGKKIAQEAAKNMDKKDLDRVGRRSDG